MFYLFISDSTLILNQHKPNTLACRWLFGPCSSLNWAKRPLWPGTQYISWGQLAKQIHVHCCCHQGILTHLQHRYQPLIEQECPRDSASAWHTSIKSTVELIRSSSASLSCSHHSHPLLSYYYLHKSPFSPYWRAITWIAVSQLPSRELSPRMAGEEPREGEQAVHWVLLIWLKWLLLTYCLHGDGEEMRGGWRKVEKEGGLKGKAEVCVPTWGRGEAMKHSRHRQSNSLSLSMCFGFCLCRLCFKPDRIHSSGNCT